MSDKTFFTYILTNKYNKMIYVGMTNDMARRIHEHKIKLNKGFTARYNIDKLVYFETFDYPNHAIAREKQIKGYSHAKKVALINKFNPEWKELYQDGVIVMNRP